MVSDEEGSLTKLVALYGMSWLNEVLDPLSYPISYSEDSIVGNQNAEHDHGGRSEFEVKTSSSSRNIP